MPIDTIQVYNSMGDTYEEKMENLKGFIMTYEGPKGKGITGLSKELRMNRSNLTNIFSRESNREMSVGVFMRISIHLGLLPANVSCSDTAIYYNMPLRKVMSIPFYELMIAYFRLDSL